MRFDEVKKVNRDDKIKIRNIGKEKGEMVDRPRNKIEMEWEIQVGSRKIGYSRDSKYHLSALYIVHTGKGNPHLDDGGEG